MSESAEKSRAIISVHHMLALKLTLEIRVPSKSIYSPVLHYRRSIDAVRPALPHRPDLRQQTTETYV
jgi:hypothetical protein